MHHIRLRCGLSAFFFERLAHRLIRDAIHIGEFDHAPSQEPQRPAPTSLGRLGTGERHEVGFLCAVELAGVDALAAAIRAERWGQPLLDKALADAFHRRDPGIERLGDTRVWPSGSCFGLIGLEQDLGMFEPAHIGLAARQQTIKLLALRRRERHPVFLVHGWSPASARLIRNRNAQLTFQP